MAYTQNVSMTDFGTESAEIERRRKMAELLQQQAQTPLEQQVVGGQVIPTSWTQGLAKLLQGYVGGKGQERASADQKALTGRLKSEAMDWASRMPQGSVSPMAGSAEDSAQFSMPEQLEKKPATKQEMMAWALQGGLSGNPMAAQLAGPIMSQSMKQDEPYTLSPGAIRFGVDGKPLASAPFKPDAPVKPEAPHTRTIQRGDQKVSQEFDPVTRTWSDVPGAVGPAFARQVAPIVNVGGGRGAKAPSGYRFSSDGETLEPIPGGPKDDTKPKPMPTNAVKLQQAELDAIGTAASISSDLRALSGLIDTGKLDLGVMSNLAAQGRNVLGMSNENSRNFNTFKTTLERLRNDSLRLNKGVQTEGDALRAWNELLGSLNDNKLVKQRLAEIQQINERAINLRKLNIDAIRSNYGNPPMELGGYQNQAPAVGSPGLPNQSAIDAEIARRRGGK